MRDKDIMRVGSITKTFVATVTLQLADEGQLRLDDSLEAYVAGLPNSAGDTIRELRCMRSGTFSLLDDPDFAGAYDSSFLRLRTSRAIRTRLQQSGAMLRTA